MMMSIPRRSAVLALALAACAGTQKRPESAAMTAPSAPAHPAAQTTGTSNPLLAPWQGPWGGVPPFGKFNVADIRQAMEEGMAQNLAEVDRIASDPEPASYENTIVALERAGQLLTRAQAVYGVYTSAMNDDEMQKVQSDISPRLAAVQDRIVQNAKLFARVAAVYEKRESLKLTPEQRRLLWLDYTGFVRQGAKLDDAPKKQLADLNQQLASLSTKFSQNLLAEEGTQMVVLEKEEDLAGLSPGLREQAAAAATAHGQPGRWAIVNTRSSTDPFLTFSTRRDLREKVWRMFVMRGDNGDARDNNSSIAQILELRARKAKLLGYPTYAHWKIEDQMARTPERTVELMEAVWKPALARAREEVADMQAVADQEKAGIKIAAWDYRHYAEKVRKAKYDLDESDVKPYLQLEKLREGMFFVAGELFGYEFVPIADGSIPVYQPDVRVWEVRGAGGKHVGLWYFDPYARQGKGSGAWMNEYRAQQRVIGDVAVIVSNNANFVRGKPGEPVLISWDDAITLFHEFGHALHGLSSNVTYPSLAGTSVPRDYVEFPSQLLERWLTTRPVLDRFALHFETGRPIPEELVGKIERSRTFNQGFATVEYLSSALVDMKLHLAPPTRDPRQFEKDTLAALGMPPEIVMRHRTAQFHHVFADGYEAGYYSYLWADTLSADAWEAFVEGGGPFDKAVARRLHDDVFSVGNTVDPADGYRAFRGRDPGTGALMRKRGFQATAVGSAQQSRP